MPRPGESTHLGLSPDARRVEWRSRGTEPTTPALMSPSSSAGIHREGSLAPTSSWDRFRGRCRLCEAVTISTEIRSGRPAAARRAEHQARPWRRQLALGTRRSIAVTFGDRCLRRRTQGSGVLARLPGRQCDCARRRRCRRESDRARALPVGGLGERWPTAVERCPTWCRSGGVSRGEPEDRSRMPTRVRNGGPG